MSIRKGIWWTGSEEKQPVQTSWHIKLSGDPDAWQRNKLQFWRMQWRWHLFSVDLDCCPEDAWRGYYVYCHTVDATLRARRWVRTPYFFARLGPEDVTFWAAYRGRNHCQPLPIKHLGDGEKKRRWTAGNMRNASRKTVCNWGNAVSL